MTPPTGGVAKRWLGPFRGRGKGIRGLSAEAIARATRANVTVLTFDKSMGLSLQVRSVSGFHAQGKAAGGNNLADISLWGS